MSTIHQIYCTHCTHGSSALERREGELAHRMLGYSARAGSLDAPELRRCYRQVERYLYYYLPRDTPAEEKLRLTAGTAPRRLIYLPSTNGLQILGQICYRPTDTEGRPGSYFAHVLFREEKDGQPAWSVLDALRLWGASGWVEEDSPHIDFRLAPLQSFVEMLGAKRPAIHDGPLESFLNASAGASFDDPGNIIPSRWRAMEPSRRTALLVDAFAGSLEVRAGRRESLLLIAEPSVAALVYYGIARLLPPGSLRDGISFSTFEPSSDRTTTALAATCFFDPEHNDVRPESYRTRGVVLNTFNERRSEGRRTASIYAEEMVRCLREEGWQAVERRLHSLQSAGTQRLDDLNALAGMDRLVPALLDPRLPLPGDDGRRSTAATDYLRRALAHRLSQLSDVDTALEPVVGQPAHLPILELIATEPELPGTRIAAQFLLRRLPGDRIADLLKAASVSLEAKLDVLANYVAAHLCLPPGCERLWNERSPAQAAAKGPTLLSRMLARLPAETLAEFYGRMRQEHSDVFLAALIEACQRSKRPPLGLTRIVETLDDEAVLSLVGVWGPAILQSYPEHEPALGRRLQAIVGTLPEQVSQFSERLDLVLAGRHLLPEDGSLDMATAWAACRAAICDLGRIQEQKSAMLSHRRLHEMEQAARRMAEAAARAMPRDLYQDDVHGSWKQERLRQVGRRLLGKSLLMPNVRSHQAVWQKITWFFESGRWPTTPLSRFQRRDLSPRKAVLIAAGVAVVAFTLLGSSLYLIERFKPRTAPIAGVPSKVAAASTPERAEPRNEASSTPSPSLRPAEPILTPTATRANATPDRPDAMAEEDSSAPVEAAPATAEPKRSDQAPASEAEFGPWAKHFAARADAVILEKEPLSEAKLEIPLTRFRDSALAGAGCLTGGWLYLDRGAYEFGMDFDAKRPTARREIPELAKQRHLKSVAVCLAARSDALVLTVTADPDTLPGEKTTALRGEIETLRKSKELLSAHLVRCQQEARSPDALKAVQEQIAALLNLTVPSLPPRPNRADPASKEDPKAYSQTLAAFERKQSQRDELLAAMPRRAEDAIRSANDAIAAREAELNRITSEERKRHDSAVEQLKADCRSISVVVYRLQAEPVEGAPSGKKRRPAKRATASETPAADEKPAPAPAVSEPAPERLIPTVPARIDDLPRRDAADRTTAQVVVRLGGEKLNQFKRDYLVGWQLSERGPDGATRGPIREFPDFDAEPSCLVSGDTRSVTVRFTFARRARAEGQSPARIAQTPEHSLKVQPGAKYEVQLRLDAETQHAVSRWKAN